MIDLDLATEFGARAARRLTDDRVGWLTTVNAKGSPQSSTVWFLWDGSTLLVYSAANLPKVRNIAANPLVNFHLNGDADGGDLIILQGKARIDPDAPKASRATGYVQKYTADLRYMGNMTWDACDVDYTAAIRIEPSSIRGR